MIFNKKVNKLTLDMRIKSKAKKIQDLSKGGNMIARLLVSPRFKRIMRWSLEAM